LSIIAALSFRGAMRSAASSRRSEAWRPAESGRGVKPDGLGEPRLPVVEGPEALGLQFQRAGYMERVEGTNAEGGAVLCCKNDAAFPQPIRKTNRSPNPPHTILLEFVPGTLRLKGRQLLSEDVLLERVGQLTFVQGSDPDGRKRAHSADCLGRMDILNAIGDQEAGIYADGQ